MVIDKGKNRHRMILTRRLLELALLAIGRRWLSSPNRTIIVLIINRLRAMAFFTGVVSRHLVCFLLENMLRFGGCWQG